MKKLLVALSLAITLIVVPNHLYAKAGSSTSSTARTTSSFGTKANSAPATKQYSSTAIQPTTTTTKPTTPPTAQSSSSTQSTTRPSTPSSTTTTTSIPTTTVVHTTEQSSGSGIGTAIVGSMIGSTVGTVVGNSINGNHAQGTVVSNGYQQPYQQTAQQPYQSTGVAISSAPQVVHEQPTTSVFVTVFVWFMKLLLVIVLLYGMYRLYEVVKRRLMMKTMSYEKNIPTLANNFTKIQTLVSLNTMDSKLQLTKLCTPQMYHYLTTIASENADRGHSNVVNSIKVLDCTTREVTKDEDSGSVYHSVKIRSSFIDYVIDNRGAVISGSSTTPITDIEVWTFVLNLGDNTWRLSAIEEYVQ